jgi:hypothetical protein
MNVNFRAILAAMGPGAAFRIANTARTAADYLFAQLLPEQTKFSYDIQSGNMTIRATMAGLVGMDSPYPPGGAIDTRTFAERTAKIANEVPLNEQTLRALQEMVMRLQLNNAPTNDAVTRQVLNFVQKIIVQPHLDTMEWLRGQALVTGAIDWTFGKIRLQVDYGVPVGNFLTNRTGNNAYGGSTSKFWDDIRTIRRTLGSVRTIIAHPTTIDEIRYNPVNAVITIDEGAGGVRMRKVNSDGVPTQDVSDVITLVAYDKEADVLDPTGAGVTVKVPFMPTGKLLGVGNNQQSGFSINVGAGGTDDLEAQNALGYTHIAPTIEGGGRPGRWADVFTPEHEPYKIIGRGVTNGLPVIEAPEKIVVASTDIS